MGVQKLVQVLNLQARPDGTFYTETFRDDSVKLPTSSLPSHCKEGRSISITLYCLLPTGSKTKMHRLSSGEALHFLSGEPLTVLQIDETGHVIYTVLGDDLDAGQVPQHFVPPRVWFGTYPTMDHNVDAQTGTIETLPVRDKEQNYSLLGITMAPAYEAEDYEVANRSHLLKLCPKDKSAIELLTDPDY